MELCYFGVHKNEWIHKDGSLPLPARSSTTVDKWPVDN
ncbi:hypothetical protein SP41_113 [Salmonella phage 41]|nr:hypothetical protein SP41_113 [Salmonella phage 41]